MIKNTIVILACSALLAPLAVAQTRSAHKRQITITTEQPIIVTGTIIPSAIEQGAAASYQPAGTLVVRVDGTNDSRRYVLNGRGYVVNTYGEAIRPPLKPGTHVRVYYVNVGNVRVVDHVVVD
jgi:hypothetical protein